MRELFKLGVGFIDTLSALIFGIPIFLIGVALLMAAFSPSKHDGVKLEYLGHCGIVGVAEGVFYEVVSTKGMKETRRKECFMDFLPGQWEGVSIYGKECKTKSNLIDLNGKINEIRKPGEIGLNVPKIKVCQLILDETQAEQVQAAFAPGK